MRATRVGGGLENRHLVKSGADVSENGLCNRRDLLSCDSKAFEHFTMECCIEQLFRLPTTRILAWNICWLALVPEPIGITSCKPTPRTYPHDAQLDYFRVADDSG